MTSVGENRLDWVSKREACEDGALYGFEELDGDCEVVGGGRAMVNDLTLE